MDNFGLLDDVDPEVREMLQDREQINGTLQAVNEIMTLVKNYLEVGCHNLLFLRNLYLIKICLYNYS